MPNSPFEVFCTNLFREVHRWKCKSLKKDVICILIFAKKLLLLCKKAGFRIICFEKVWFFVNLTKRYSLKVFIFKFWCEKKCILLKCEYFISFLIKIVYFGFRESWIFYQQSYLFIFIVYPESLGSNAGPWLKIWLRGWFYLIFYLKFCFRMMWICVRFVKKRGWVILPLFIQNFDLVKIGFWWDVKKGRG